MPPKPPAAPVRAVATRSTSSAIAITDEVAANQLATWREPLALYAPPRLNVDAWLQTALLCIMDPKAKKLREAMTTEKGRASLINSMKYGISTGLSLNPLDKQACLIPFGQEITFLVEKDGMCELALNTGTVAFIGSDTVHENDIWIPKRTAHGDDFEFSPARKERGTIEGYFSFVTLKAEWGGTSHLLYMTVAEVEAWRDSKVPKSHLFYSYDDDYGKPPKFKKGDKIEDSLWWAHPDQAAIKTVIRNNLKALKLPSIEKVLEMEDELETSRFRNVTPLKGTGAADLAATLGAKQTEPEPEPEPEDRTETAGDDPGNFDGSGAPATSGDEQPGLGLEGDAKPAQSAPVAPSKASGTPAKASAAPARPSAPKPASASAPKPATAAQKPAAPAAPAINPAIPVPLRGDVACANDACKKRFLRGQVDEAHLISGICPACGTGKLIDDSIF